MDVNNTKTETETETKPAFKPFKPLNFYSFKFFHLKKGLSLDEIKALYDIRNERKRVKYEKGYTDCFDDTYRKSCYKEYYETHKNTERYIKTKYECLKRFSEKQLEKLKKENI